LAAGEVEAAVTATWLPSWSYGRCYGNGRRRHPELGNQGQSPQESRPRLDNCLSLFVEVLLVLVPVYMCSRSLY